MRVLLCILLALFISCDNKMPEPHFREGDLVASVIDGRVGQVVTRFNMGSGWNYDVRFSSGTTDESRPYATITMKEFELERAARPLPEKGP